MNCNLFAVMAEASRNNHDNGIPSGLNRIKTRGGVSKPDELIESRSYGVSRPPQKHKQKTVAQGHVKLANSSTEGLFVLFFFLVFLFVC